MLPTELQAVPKTTADAERPRASAVVMTFGATAVADVEQVSNG